MPPHLSQPPARAPRLSEVRDYLRAPRFVQRRRAMDADGLIHLLLLLGATLLGIFIITPILGGIVMSVMGDLPNNSIENIDMQTLFWLGVVIAPIWEELVYRS